MSSTLFAGREKSDTRALPMMPLRDVVIFPYMMSAFVVGRDSSIRALEDALAADKKIFLATQHDASVDEPKPNEIYQVGTIANIVQSLFGAAYDWPLGAAISVCILLITITLLSLTEKLEKRWSFK